MPDSTIATLQSNFSKLQQTIQAGTEDGSISDIRAAMAVLETLNRAVETFKRAGANGADLNAARAELASELAAMQPILDKGAAAMTGENASVKPAFDALRARLTQTLGTVPSGYNGPAANKVTTQPAPTGPSAATADTTPYKVVNGNIVPANPLPKVDAAKWAQDIAGGTVLKGPPSKAASSYGSGLGHDGAAGTVESFQKAAIGAGILSGEGLQAADSMYGNQCDRAYQTLRGELAKAGIDAGTGTVPDAAFVAALDKYSAGVNAGTIKPPSVVLSRFITACGGQPAAAAPTTASQAAPSTTAAAGPTMMESATALVKDGFNKALGTVGLTTVAAAAAAPTPAPATAAPAPVGTSGQAAPAAPATVDPKKKVELTPEQTSLLTLANAMKWKLGDGDSGGLAYGAPGATPGQRLGGGIKPPSELDPTGQHGAQGKVSVWVDTARKGSLTQEWTCVSASMDTDTLAAFSTQKGLGSAELKAWSDGIKTSLGRPIYKDETTSRFGRR